MPDKIHHCFMLALLLVGVMVGVWFYDAEPVLGLIAVMLLFQGFRNEAIK